MRRRERERKEVRENIKSKTRHEQMQGDDIQPRIKRCSVPMLLGLVISWHYFFCRSTPPPLNLVSVFVIAFHGLVLVYFILSYVFLPCIVGDMIHDKGRKGNYQEVDNQMERQQSRRRHDKIKDVKARDVRVLLQYIGQSETTTKHSNSRLKKRLNY
jgi:hypothetical protein